MRRLIRFIIRAVILIIALLIVAVLLTYVSWALKARSHMASLGAEAPVLTLENHRFRDLNKNGKLDPYEDTRAPLDARVDDVLAQMTLEEKAGTMFINFTVIGENGALLNRPYPTKIETLLFPANAELVAGKLMNHASLLQPVDDPIAFSKWHNAMQKLAERTRLGIPMTFASDPRHGKEFASSIGVPAGAFSVWPDALGLAAARDPELTRQFADIARQEYRAVGIHLALHPVADLATEPRWARISGTFGEDAHLSAQMVKAYVEGMQGEALGPTSVATMVKHFSGGGPQKDGEDAHFPYGQDQAYPGNNFDYHLIPFEDGAFPANTAQIMPYYGVPVGQTDEDVGFAYSKDIITGLLRDRYQFDGVVCTDWGLITDAKLLGKVMILPARAWGAEALTPEQRMIKLLDAGNDQFGGENIPELLVGLVRTGKITETRLDVSVRRLLRDKFRLGLFDDPYVDADASQDKVGTPAFVSAGIEAQKRSLVLLKNGTEASPVLPLRAKPKLYIENIDPQAAARFADIVDSPAQADFALIRLSTPYEPREGLMESIMHAGDLDFKSPEKEHLLALMQTVPTITAIYIERAAVIPDIAAQSTALIAEFGANDDVLLGAIFGEFAPTGKLPLELPSSMDAVRAQKEDVPYDSQNPLYPFGHGLTYEISEPEP